MIRRIIAILVLFTAHAMFETDAQAVSVFTMDNAMVNGYMVIAVGNDPTMVTGTKNNIACADAIRQYVRDTSGYYAKKAISVTSTGSGAASYNNTTGVFNIPNTTYTPYVPTVYDSVIRSLDVAYLVSPKDAFLCYSVRISVTVSLALGASSSGRVTPKHKAPGGAYWKNCPYVENSPSLTGLGILSVGLLSANVYQMNVSIPAGDSVIFATSTSGGNNATFALFPGQDKY